MKLKLFCKTNNYWRRKLRPEGENIKIIQWNITTKFLSRRFTYQSFFILGHSYLSNSYLFACCRRFFNGANRTLIFTGQSPSSNLLKRFLDIIARKKGEPTIPKNLTLHQPVLKCSKPY